VNVTLRLQTACDVQSGSHNYDKLLWHMGSAMTVVCGCVSVWHCRYVQRCPLSFLQSGSVKPLLACAIAGCALDHKEANYSVTKFLSELSKTARDKEVSYKSFSLNYLCSPVLSLSEERHRLQSGDQRKPVRGGRRLLDLMTKSGGCCGL